MGHEYGVPIAGLELKADGESWEVSGYLSTFGNTDLGGDVVMPGAFDRTLASVKTLPLLLGHDPGIIIGASRDLKADQRGLFARFALSHGPDGLNAHENLKVGALGAFSIGYRAQQAEYTDDGVRKLLDVDLIEGSLLPPTMPMNPLAEVTGFKDLPREVPFDVLMQRVSEALRAGVDEAKALHARRQSEQRELSERHLEALKALLAQVEAVPSELTALLPVVQPEAKAGGEDILTRLRLARHRAFLRDHGLLPLEHAS